MEYDEMYEEANDEYRSMNFVGLCILCIVTAFIGGLIGFVLGAIIF